jgi:hypothetical protein
MGRRPLGLGCTWLRRRSSESSVSLGGSPKLRQPFKPLPACSCSPTRPEILHPCSQPPPCRERGVGGAESSGAPSWGLFSCWLSYSPALRSTTTGPSSITEPSIRRRASYTVLMAPMKFKECARSLRSSYANWFGSSRS